MKSIILAGGGGTRLFPLSRGKYPKQFMTLGDDEPLLRKTVIRNLKALKKESDIVIVANKEYEFHIKNQLRDLNVDRMHIILEPTGRNTAPAVALAVKYILEILGSDEEEVLIISPSDHIIHPDDKFVDYIKKGESLAREGYIVTFGVCPSKPETGYGYIEAGSPVGEAFKVRRFHEKPDLDTAIKHISAGNYYWNSGIFMFSIKTILQEFEKHSSEIFDFINSKSFEEMINTFEAMPNISIDYAIMEKTDRAVVLPMSITWSDVGSWDSLYEVLEKDENKNVKIGNIIDLDTKNSLIIANQRLVATIGVENLIIVETPDVILIAKRGDGQKVKDLVSIIREDEKFKHMADYHTTFYRPWGSYTELERGDGYRVRRIRVLPKHALSLQLHHHRSEHWVVVKGTAKVILEDEEGKEKEYYVHENESIYVPKGVKHRLINPGDTPLEIIEVQVGDYIGEDDIVRLEDKPLRL